jgi:ATP-dependent DNA helicase RecQ
MIDESPAGDEFKRVQRGKLDALLALCEAHDCRRVRLLGYFGEASPPDAGPPQDRRSPLGGQGEHEVPTVGAPYNCGNCDNCLSPPATWDATEAARKALSCIYRFSQHRQGPRHFGVAHLIDVLRGKPTEKVAQFGHERLSTYGIGADLAETQWRGVLRQLVALGHVVVEGEYNTLALAESAKSVLRGEVSLSLRVPAAAPAKRGRTARSAGGSPHRAAVVDLDAEGQRRYAALRAWRSEVAKEHNRPAFVVFHDTTLAEMARRAPSDLAALGEIGGVGAKKLEAYGHEILRVLGAG